MMSKEDILAVKDLRMESVDVPEWGAAVFVRAMSGTERDRFEEVWRNGGLSFRSAVVCFTVCDQYSKRLFAESDMAAIGEKSSVAMDRILAAAVRMNGIGEEAEKKDSVTTPGDAGSSA
jgi:hypothetical protein